MPENIIQYILIAVTLVGVLYMKEEEDESSRNSNMGNDNNSSDSGD